MAHKVTLAEINIRHQILASGNDKQGYVKIMKRAMYLGKTVFIVEAKGEEAMVMSTIENAILHYNSL